MHRNRKGIEKMPKVIKVSKEVSIQFNEVACADCGEELVADITHDAWGDFTIKVEPCKVCMEARAAWKRLRVEEH